MRGFRNLLLISFLMAALAMCGSSCTVGNGPEPIPAHSSAAADSTGKVKMLIRERNTDRLMVVMLDELYDVGDQFEEDNRTYVIVRRQ